MIVAIHQPNFFPWLGYFAKIARADRFILLDHVEFSRGSWVNRVRLLIGGAPRWITAPVHRDGSHLAITSLRLDEGQPWRRRLTRTLQAGYGRCPHFDSVMPVVDDLLAFPGDGLAAFNAAVVRRLSHLLGLTAQVELASTIAADHAGCRPESARGSELLVALCRAVGASTYLAGQGAGGYEDPGVYAAADLRYRTSDFVVRPYRQRGTGEFVAGLSVLDALFNVGPEATRLLLEAPRQDCPDASREA